MTLRYVSTRGGGDPIPFADAVLTGLAADGGLLLPERFPNVAGELAAWRQLSFTELAQRLFHLYVDDIAAPDIDAIIADAFAAFDHPDVVPITDLGEFRLLELFHGPTLSFKDVALQVLGRLFERILKQRGARMNILGATSGDTGSAAIHGVRGRANIGIFVLYPNGRVSPLQELQMTCVTDANVHCLAIDGSFDDCQAIVKDLFGDLALKEQYGLGAVNSMNWARVLAQMSYYAYASVQSPQPPTFAVPTGNFGNIFAGLAARQMGMPVERFVLATNDNDILARFFQTGIYRRGPVHHTISPSMDIQIASNFERFLYLRLGRDAARVQQFLADFATTGEARLEDGKPIDEGIAAVAVSEDDTLATIRDVYQRHGYVLDPHTAVGVAAAHRVVAAEGASSGPICMAAAHPAKFPDPVGEATGGAGAVQHPTLAQLDPAQARKAVLPADLHAVKAYVQAHAI